MNQRNFALSRFHDLWADFGKPGFIWQIIALVICIFLAWLAARWWYRHLGSGSKQRLQDASARLSFPLNGMIFVGIALLALKPFFPVTILKMALPLLAALMLVRGGVYVLHKAFPRATWLVTGERIIAGLVWGWLALHITDLMPYLIDVLEEVDFVIGKQKINLWMIIHGLVTVFLTVVFALWIAGVIESRLMRMKKMDSSIRMVFVRIAKALLTVIAIITSLSLVGIDMTALSVFTGALGVGLGLGLQKIASNYVSGFIILLDRSIRLGDTVQVGTADTTGQVTQITTRYTVLKHPSGIDYIVPNESLIGSIVQNQSYSSPRVRLTITIGVAYDSDLALAMRLMMEAASSKPRVLKDPAPSVILTQFADSSIVLELGFWVADPENGKGNIKSDISLTLWQSFKENNIDVPFPQRDVRIISGDTEIKAD